MSKTYAVGNSNTITRLDNHTGPWIELSSPVLSNSIWRDVMTNPLDENNVFIVGSARAEVSFANASILTSNDAGITWNIPGGNWTSVSYFYEIWCVDENVIWATASEGKVVLSIDGGATFDLVSGIVGNGAYFQTAGIHALDDQVAIVLGSPSESVTQSELYVWKTIDGGTTWVTLNGGVTLDPIGLSGDTGNANGIWMSPDQQKIVVGTGYYQYLSLDGGVTFTDVNASHDRSGIHLTWFPSYDPNPQYFRHTGGIAHVVSESVDSGISYTDIRGLNTQGILIQILGAHFYAPYDGYYGYHDNGIAYIDSTNDGGITGTVSHTNSNSGASYNAIWTSVEIPPFVQCFELTDCAGIALPIFTQTNLTEQDGLVITLADETNHEIEGCWLVTATDITCPDTVSVAVYKCYEDCEDCLPCPEPIKEPQPRLIDPGYVTGICDPEIVEKIKCSFSDIIYKRMMSIRYMIQYCCPKDNYQIMIDYEILKLNLITSPNPTPDPCDPICSTYELTIDSLDSAITTYIDCDGEAQTLITLVGTTFIRLCALDTTPPISIVTHPDTLTDVYILEPQEECNPPYI
tara:strand:- start:20436 stop:22163 length:1728 start_codon:yes stop_codon:yes gene_type:complete